VFLLRLLGLKSVLIRTVVSFLVWDDIVDIWHVEDHDLAWRLGGSMMLARHHDLILFLFFLVCLYFSLLGSR
jgi:hypothetical protein